MKRHHYAPVTEATALEALELDAADAAEYARYGTAEDRADAATAADTLERARRGDWSAPSSAPRHRDTVRPVDSYSLAVDPYRAPRHLNYSATLSAVTVDREDYAARELAAFVAGDYAAAARIGAEYLAAVGGAA